MGKECCFDTLCSKIMCSRSHFIIIILSLCHIVMDVIRFRVNREITSGLSILLHGIISLPAARSYDSYKSIYHMTLLIFSVKSNVINYAMTTDYISLSVGTSSFMVTSVTTMQIFIEINKLCHMVSRVRCGT